MNRFCQCYNKCQKKASERETSMKEFFFSLFQIRSEANECSSCQVIPNFRKEIYKIESATTEKIDDDYSSNGKCILKMSKILNIITILLFLFSFFCFGLCSIHFSLKYSHMCATQSYRFLFLFPP